MKISLFLLFLSFPFIGYTSELPILYRTYHHLITPKTTYELQNKEAFFVDFGKGISATKTAHIQVHFPDDLTFSPVFPLFPNMTPEIKYFAEKYSEEKNMLSYMMEEKGDVLDTDTICKEYLFMNGYDICMMENVKIFTN